MLMSTLMFLFMIINALAIPAPMPLMTSLDPRQCKDKTKGGAGDAQVKNYNAQAGDGRGGRGGWRNTNQEQGQAQPKPSPVDQEVSLDVNNRMAETRTSTRTVVITEQPKSSATTRTRTRTSNPQPDLRPQPDPKPSPQPVTTTSTGGGGGGSGGGGGGVSEFGRKGKISSQDPKQLLGLHNDYRAARGKPALSWNEEQANYAANYALDCNFKHSGGKYGENLAMGSKGQAAGLFKMWTDEEKDYDKNNPQYSHYTQVVWAKTKLLGCAFIDCPAGSMMEAKYGISTYLICEYDTGNVIGQFADNV